MSEFGDLSGMSGTAIGDPGSAGSAGSAGSPGSSPGRSALVGDPGRSSDPGRSGGPVSSPVLGTVTGDTSDPDSPGDPGSSPSLQGSRASLIKGVDHVAIAVSDLEAAISFYDKMWGARVAYREYIEKDKVNEALIAVGGSYLQLLSPSGPESPVARYLERRGEGIHHVGYRVDDCAEVLQAMKAAGARLIDEAPRPGSRGTTIAFVHPASAFGTLIELVEEG
ncbi:MAG: methylmalonyl-CoA epimerase [Acidimicrobiales bacterium]